MKVVLIISLLSGTNTISKTVSFYRGLPHTLICGRVPGRNRALFRCVRTAASKSYNAELLLWVGLIHAV